MLALLKPSKKSVLKQENFGSKRVYSPSSFCCFLGKSALYDVGIMSVFCQNELLCDEKNESGPCLRWIPSFNVHIIAVPLVGHYAFSLFCSHGIPVSRPPPKKKTRPWMQERVSNIKTDVLFVRFMQIVGLPYNLAFNCVF